jgi:hypothetical protein
MTHRIFNLIAATVYAVAFLILVLDMLVWAPH